MTFPGYNYFLIVITAVVCVLAVLVALYMLIAFQHPEDRNQAWFPKAVVIFGISLAIWTVLLIPLDVANRQACYLPHCSIANQYLHSFHSANLVNVSCWCCNNLC